ncbi:actin-like ATPase domain-containing protein [Gloeophyllum trabeum ATCC 11539]|uniref:Actin-like ATPase domain-containing protein n=1 Tax=Gloeophyllum trabeum (strain ATCC 11539 / FP-39264 / Madison 617) TaxID=670483 RepID=S7QB60_GLOTA|nr:actin-like ATPase domain-containing protein [Gloeophyllum trabeum ATCC 11539]EPQ56568.1 actin-like ATPase domain-containing protein [Gloeophyllum trabeum ATCC 11539]
MPRGVPNAKRDETGFRYTTFHVPLAPNPKQMGSAYLKSESQTLWARNTAQAQANNKNKSQPEEPTTGHPGVESRRGSQVLVIHPGSRYLRIGRASDVNPLTVPNVIAHKHKPPVPEPVFVEGISRPRKSRSGRPTRRRSTSASQTDEYAVQALSDDPFEEKLAAITLSLRARMKFYKLRVTPNATSIASTFNEQFKPEVISDESPVYRKLWITEPPEESFLDYSVVLVIPDFYDRAYVRDLVNILLVSMGFKQICVQQESLAATYGAGISNACVVDIGAVTTSVACVDEGMVIPDTRISLNMGGNDITEFLYVLLDRINFPYRDVNLARWYDWEADVALNLYDFTVRQPNKHTMKYGLRAYDEIILAPMCVFEPRVIEFDRKRVGMRPSSHPDVTEEIVESATDHVTQAMLISTQHLLPVPEMAADPPPPELPQATAALGGDNAPIDVEGQAEPKATEGDEAQGTAPTDVPMDVVDTGDESKAAPPASAAGTAAPSSPIPRPSSPATAQASLQPQLPTAPLYPGGYAIDVCFEASKLPLDVAIFNSARAAGGDDKIRKYLQAVLVVGGTSRLSGMAHALESRLQAIATPLVPNMEKVQIIPPPKDVDPQVLQWKGAAVLGKMEGVLDLWLTAKDWGILGMRGLKERCFYL